MKAEGIIDECESCDVRLNVIGDNLELRYPAGALSASLEDTLIKNKKDVIKCLVSGRFVYRVTIDGNELTSISQHPTPSLHKRAVANRFGVERVGDVIRLK